MQPILLRFIAIALAQNSQALAIATDLHLLACINIVGHNHIQQLRSVWGKAVQ